MDFPRQVKDRLADGLWMTSAGGEISKTKEGAVDTSPAEAEQSSHLLEFVYLFLVYSYVLHGGLDT